MALVLAHVLAFVLMLARTMIQSREFPRKKPVLNVICSGSMHRDAQSLLVCEFAAMSPSKTAMPEDSRPLLATGLVFGYSLKTKYFFLMRSARIDIQQNMYGFTRRGRQKSQ